MKDLEEQLKLIESSDGSHTLFVPALNEHYHSTNGAIQESLHVFIDAGLKQLSGLGAIRIFEAGFGTGLNAFLSLLEAENIQRIIYYTSVELHPLEMGIAERLNYPDLLAPEKRDKFLQMHSCQWNTLVQLSKYFILEKKLASLVDIHINEQFHLIYFDAFAPEKQPELWTPEIFLKMYDMLLPGGLLLTYCAKGQVRRNMLAAGFKVERIPGPPGKRQMMRASK